ncbi:MAG TPA: SDR family NAD(P)-dependent oxidoreductase [Spirochaetota bacterium]|nr:SDR family NAD(P)-dependent oxidoreductase [Spirochaetota bacterium]
MTDYNGKVVVITGAANGIGKELALRFADSKAKLALADIDKENLEAVGKEIKGKGADVLTSVLDVSDYGAMENFSKAIFEKFGNVDYLFNNAGVISGGTIWEMPLNEWDWLFNVNVMGIVNGVKLFVPSMIKQDTECKVVNTASFAGLTSGENLPAYVASKFAALSLTEVLELQLQEAAPKVKAYAVCPAVVKTDLKNCMRHRPAELYNPDDPYYKTEDYKKKEANIQNAIDTGKPVNEAVNTILEGIENDIFYILTHPEYNPLIGLRAQNIMKGTRPVKFQQ